MSPSLWCPLVHLRCKSASIAAFAATTCAPMRTSRICSWCGDRRPTPWQPSVQLCHTQMAFLRVRAALPRSLWAYNEATTREALTFDAYLSDMQHGMLKCYGSRGMHR